jgi:hypothetical protein
VAAVEESWRHEQGRDMRKGIEQICPFNTYDKLSHWIGVNVRRLFFETGHSVREMCTRGSGLNKKNIKKIDWRDFNL